MLGKLHKISFSLNPSQTFYVNVRSSLNLSNFNSLVRFLFLRDFHVATKIPQPSRSSKYSLELDESCLDLRRINEFAWKIRLTLASLSFWSCSFFQTVVSLLRVPMLRKEIAILFLLLFHSNISGFSLRDKSVVFNNIEGFHEKWAMFLQNATKFIFPCREIYVS